MFGKYNGFVSKARVSACMYFLVNGESTAYISGSPAKSGPMTLTSENRFPLFFVC